MSTALSTPDAAILNHVAPLDPRQLASTSSASRRPIRDLYDVDRTVDALVSRGAKVVALQFPDELLRDAVPVFWALRGELEARGLAEDAVQLYIMADTSYGSCCVDEVTALHVSADLVVHYGHACLSPTARLDVHYVFPKLPIDVQDAAEALLDELERSCAEEEEDDDDARDAGGADRGQNGRGDAHEDAASSRYKAVLLTYDVGYEHAAADVGRIMRQTIGSWRTAPDGEGSSGTSVSGTSRNSRARQRAAKLPLCVTTIDVETTGRAEGGGRREDRPLRASSCGAGDANEECGASCRCQAATSRGVPSPTSATTMNSEPSDGAATTNQQREGGEEPTTRTGRAAAAAARNHHLPEGVRLSDVVVLYLGGESLALTNLLLRAGPRARVASYDALRAESARCRREDGSTNRLLMRRYAAVQRARDARTVALLVGTLGVRSYLPLLASLRRRLADAKVGGGASRGGGAGAKGGKGGMTTTQRKVYTISVGRLTPAKLANFHEVDCFVLLACAESSVVEALQLQRSRDHLRTIVTPFEMDVALRTDAEGGREWDGSYELELDEVVARSERAERERAERRQRRRCADGREGQRNGRGNAGGEADADEDADAGSDSDEDHPHFSLVRRGYVSHVRDDVVGQEGDGYGGDDLEDTRRGEPRAGDDGGGVGGGALTTTTEQLAHHRRRAEAAASQGTVLALDAQGREVVVLRSSAAARHLATRSWRGLGSDHAATTKEDEDDGDQRGVAATARAAAVLEQGRDGWATGGYAVGEHREGVGGGAHPR